MRKSFDVLWEVMEARRRQLEAGEVPPACRLEQTRQDRRRAKGCPDDEALCGWVDGQLRRSQKPRSASCRSAPDPSSICAASAIAPFKHVQLPAQSRPGGLIPPVLFGRSGIENPYTPFNFSRWRL
jgi:hypothetical protein